MPETNHPLYAFLECTVPLAIADIERRGGPDNADWEQARAFADTLGEQGDQLLYRDQATARLASQLARALAVLAFVPGGVTVGPLRWECRVPPEVP